MIEAQNLIRQRTNHVCRLCCSRAPQTVLQGATLDCSNETHCSAAWSMAPAGYPTCILGATAEAPRQGHGSATQPNKPNKTPRRGTNKLGKTPTTRQGKEVPGKNPRNLKGTVSAGLSDHNRQTAFLGLGFKISKRISHTIQHAQRKLGS